MRLLRLLVPFAFVLSLVLPPLRLAAEPLAVLAPSQPTVDATRVKDNGGAPASEVDMLLGLVDPFPYTGKDMDSPQMFAVIVYNAGENGFETERRDLLGDLEEIRHIDTRAWGANVAVDRPGLYQFIMETKPWWSEKQNRFLRQQAKVIVPALGVEEGWSEPTGQALEITPLTRPFGLASPALFSGRILADGKPLANTTVEMGYINSPKKKVASEWNKVFKAKTDSLGQFSFVLNRPGWWYCKASVPGSPLKGSDGELKELEKSSLLWLYVD